MRWLVVPVTVRSGGFEVRSSERWYPRVAEGDTPEEAIDRMYDEPRFAGEKKFLVLPVYDESAVITVRPRREFEYNTEHLGLREVRGKS